jgi:YHS domain-containing protein
VTETSNSQANAIITACGGRIKDPERFPSAIFQGERVYFCTPDCLHAFESDPERFMAGEMVHPQE